MFHLSGSKANSRYKEGARVCSLAKRRYSRGINSIPLPKGAMQKAQNVEWDRNDQSEDGESQSSSYNFSEQVIGFAIGDRSNT